jgi:hypothetical protein
MESIMPKKKAIIIFSLTLGLTGAVGNLALSIILISPVEYNLFPSSINACPNAFIIDKA